MKKKIKAKKAPTVTVFELAGGIGNQLFQFAAGLYFAERTGRRVIFDTTVIDSAANTQGKITDSFVLPGDFRSFGRGFGKFLRMRSRILSQISIRQPEIARLFRMSRLAYVSPAVGLDNDLVKSSNRAFIRGYFQTYEYVEYLQEQNLWPELVLRDPSPWFQDLARQFVSIDLGCVHLRRGDYVNLGDKYGLLSSSYYLSALQSLPQGLQRRKWMIFSDDVVEARRLAAHLSPAFEVQVICPPQESDPAESLALMSLCSVQIIANSTFSYWAALWNQKASGILSPSPWYSRMREPEGLLPAKWTRIQSEWL